MPPSSSSDAPSDFSSLYSSQSLYSVLNVSHTASTEEIQKSFKLLSKTFHPDKQQQRLKIQQNQEPFSFLDEGDDKKDEDGFAKTFLELKHAYDILIDPVLRFTLDEYGYDTVRLVQQKRTVYYSVDDDEDKEKDDDDTSQNTASYHNNTSSVPSNSRTPISLYDALSILLIHQQDINSARKLIEQELQNQRYHQYHTMNYYQHKNIYRHRHHHQQQHLRMGGDNHITRQGSIEISCTTVHSPLLGEGYYDNWAPEDMETKNKKDGDDRIQGNWIEIDTSKMGFTYTFPLLFLNQPCKPDLHTRLHDSNSLAHGQWNASIGGNTTVKNGVGQSSTVLGIGYIPTPGTDIHVQCHSDFGDGIEQYKVNFKMYMCK